MSVTSHRTRLKSRYVLSLLVGLSLGLVFSLACLPLISVCDTHLSFIPKTLQNNHLSLHLRTVRSTVDGKFEKKLVDYGNQDYEPIIHSPNRSKSIISSTVTMNKSKITRPRYIADELGIKDKVLVAVLSEIGHLNTFAYFLNQSLASHVNKILFFVDDDIQEFPRGMTVVAIHDKRKYLKPFYVLKYLAEKLIKNYDWFLIVPDNTFIRGYKLIEFLNRISISQDLYMGQSYDDVHAVYCYYGSGIILSGTVLHKILDELDWCTNNAYSQDLTDNIGRCILKSAKLPCSNTASNQNYSAYVDYRFDFDSDIDKLSKSEDFNKTLTVHPVNDLETMLKLQMYFNHVEIAEIKQDIIKHEQNIEQLSCYAPEGCNEIPWPVGVPPPFRPSTRFDVLRWDYFNETHIYLETDNDVVGIMKQDYHDDVQEIINYSISQMQRIYGSSLKYQHLLNGYRQFDPTRGTHYILDLQMLDENKNEIIKRAELMRPR